MRVASVTILMRDAAALDAALAALTSAALGFVPAWAAARGAQGAVSAGVVSAGGGAALELLAAPALATRWDDRAGRAPARAALAAVNLARAGGASSPFASLDALAARVARPAGVVRSALAALGVHPLDGSEAGGPLLTVDGAAGGDDDAAPAGGASGGLKEVVLGVEGAFLDAALGVLEASRGAARDAVAMSAWRLRGCGTVLRVLPSRYSALVVHAPGGLAAVAARGVAGVLHGARRADPAAAQLLVASDALAGLDLRFCAHAGGAAARPFFNEARDVLTDVLDPRLNPEPGDSRDASIGCRAVSGMDVVSTLKLKLYGRVG